MLASTLTEEQRVSGRAVVNICTRAGVIAGPVLGTLLASGLDLLPFVLAAVVFASRRGDVPPGTGTRVDAGGSPLGAG